MQGMYLGGEKREAKDRQGRELCEPCSSLALSAGVGVGVGGDLGVDDRVFIMIMGLGAGTCPEYIIPINIHRIRINVLLIAALKMRR